MKNIKSLIYLMTAPVIIVAVLLYILFISDIEIATVFRSIQLYVYIVIGFVVVISAIHFILIKIAKEK